MSQLTFSSLFVFNKKPALIPEDDPKKQNFGSYSLTRSSLTFFTVSAPEPNVTERVIPRRVSSDPSRRPVRQRCAASPP